MRLYRRLPLNAPWPRLRLGQCAQCACIVCHYCIRRAGIDVGDEGFIGIGHYVGAPGVFMRTAAEPPILPRRPFRASFRVAGDFGCASEAAVNGRMSIGRRTPFYPQSHLAIITNLSLLIPRSPKLTDLR